MLSSDLFLFSGMSLWGDFCPRASVGSWLLVGPRKADGPSDDLEVGICFGLITRHFLDGFALLFAVVATFFKVSHVFLGSLGVA